MKLIVIGVEKIFNAKNLRVSNNRYLKKSGNQDLDGASLFAWPRRGLLCGEKKRALQNVSQQIVSVCSDGRMKSIGNGNNATRRARVEETRDEERKQPRRCTHRNHGVHVGRLNLDERSASG